MKELFTQPNPNIENPKDAVVSDIIYYATAVISAIIFSTLLYAHAPPVTDWWGTFHKVGGVWYTPYDGGFHFAYPPWMAIVLIPFHFIEIHLSRAIWAGLTTLVCAFTIRSLRGDIATFVMLLTSIPFISLVANGQTDGVVFLGLALLTFGSIYSHMAGGILLLAKPQTVSLALLIFWLNSERKKELALAGITFILATFLIWGWWVPDMIGMSQTLYAPANWAPWPYGIPLGIILLIWGYKENDIRYGALATMFFAPYIAGYSFTGPLLILYTLLPRKYALVLHVIVNILSINYYL